MKVILYHPQIPQNTGNIVRTCAVVGCDLVLIKPGFSTSNRWLKRAGLDYWEGVNVSIMDDLEEVLSPPNQESFYFFSSKAAHSYTSVKYKKNSVLIFGSETSGLPISFREKWPDQFIKIPMKNGVRCLNLATSVGIAIYEAWRQLDFYL